MPKQISQTFFWIYLIFFTGGLLASGLVLYSHRALNRQCNDHLAFSWPGSTILHVLPYIFLCGSIIWISRRFEAKLFQERLGWFLLISGGLANTLERLWWGCIHDSLPLGFGLINNPADWSIALGGFLLMIYCGKQYSHSPS